MHSALRSPLLARSHQHVGQAAEKVVVTETFPAAGEDDNLYWRVCFADIIHWFRTSFMLLQNAAEP